MIKIASRMATAAFAVSILSTSALAADLITKGDTAPAPENFDSSRLYVSVFAGANFIDDPRLTGLVGGAPQSVELEFDTGYTIGGAIGHNYGDIGNGLNFRAELELSYSESDVDQIFFSGNGPAAENNVNGDFSSTNLLVNGLIDLPELGGGVITPYIGAGIGIAFSSVDAVYGGAPGTPPPILIDTNEENFIAQAIVGASVAATDTTDFFVEGRYSRVFNFETPRFNVNAGALTGVIEDDIDTYNINVGLRFKL